MNAADAPPWLHPWTFVQFVPLSKHVSREYIKFQVSISPPTTPDNQVTHSLYEQILLLMKQKLDAHAESEEWEHKKKITNPFEYIFPGLLKETKSWSPLSRSYFKMIELLDVAGFWNEPRQRPWTTAHICEGPGGFIQAVLDRATELKCVTPTAYAMTLKPTHPHIPGWKRSIQYLRHHPEIILEYGATGTGDVLESTNQSSFVRTLKHGASLFTADGGFDFSKDYSTQEAQAIPLVIASFCMGLQTLQKGGMMIIKMFDIFSPSMKDLILGSSLFFEEVTIYKPATSRPCNSERYFIGKRFVGSGSAGLDSWISTLQHALTILKQGHTLYSLLETPLQRSLYSLFDSQIHIQVEQQVNAIQRCLTFDHSQEEVYLTYGMEWSKRWMEQFMKNRLPAASA